VEQCSVQRSAALSIAITIAVACLLSACSHARTGSIYIQLCRVRHDALPFADGIPMIALNSSAAAAAASVVADDRSWHQRDYK